MQYRRSSLSPYQPAIPVMNITDLKQQSRPDRVINATEARLRIGCSYETLCDLVKYNGLRAVPRSHSWLQFRLFDIDEFISFRSVLMDRGI